MLNSQSLECFVRNMPQPTYINSVETGEYLYGNPSSKSFIKPGEMHNKLLLSKSVIDKSISAQNKYLFCEAEMDKELLSTGNVVTHKNCIELDSAGKICFYTVIKVPVLGDSTNIVAILTMRMRSEDVIQPLDLYKLYKEIFKNKKTAIEKTILHLNIATYFEENLTEKELVCLLLMKVDASHKFLMKNLFVSKKTIETHVSNLIKKSKARSLSDVLSRLRSFII